QATSGNLVATLSAGFVAKYASSGALSYILRIDGVANDQPQAIATDTAGNVYATGRYQSTQANFYATDGTTVQATLGNLGSYAGFVSKYNSSGALLYTLCIDGTSNDTPVSIATAGDGSVYVTGYYTSTQANFYATNGTTVQATSGNLGSDAGFIVKYTSSGALNYTLRIDGVRSEQPQSITTAADGSVYATGFYSSTQANFYATQATSGNLVATLSAGFVAKYASSGALSYILRIDGTGDDYPQSITTDTFGNVYATGYYASTQANFYAADGTIQATLGNLGNNAGFIAKYVSTTVGTIIATSATTSSLLATNATFTNVTSTNMLATTFTTGQLLGTNITATNVIATNATVATASFTQLRTTAGVLNVTTGVTTVNLTATNVTSGTVRGTNAVIADTFTTTSVTAGTGTLTNVLITSDVTAANLQLTNVTVSNVLITRMTAASLSIPGGVTTGSLNYTGTLVVGGATIGTLRWGSSAGSVYITSGNVGINTTVPAFALDVTGDARITEATASNVNITNLYQGGNLVSVVSQWTTSGTTAYFTSGVAIGSSTAATALDLTGNMKVSEAITASNVVATNYISSYGNVVQTTSGSVALTLNLKTVNNRARVSRAVANTAVTTWRTRTSAANQWRSVVWSPELSIFVAVADSGTGNRVMTSVDGINWVTRTSAADSLWWSVTWASELSLFVAFANGTNAAPMTSPDGINWTTRAIPTTTNTWYGVTWSPELRLFVVVGSGGGNNGVMTSPDGITWTTRGGIYNNSWSSVVWSPEVSLFVAVALTGIGNCVMTSPDGITWTTRASAANNIWNSIAWSPELYLFVAVASSGTGTRVMTSPNGITWTTRSAADNDWRSVVWSQELGLFVAVASTGTRNRIMTSSNGINWATRTTSAGTDNNWYSIAWSCELSRFVAVGITGTNTRVMTSQVAIPAAESVLGLSPGYLTSTDGNVNLQGVMSATSVSSANVVANSAGVSGLSIASVTASNVISSTITTPTGILTSVSQSNLGVSTLTGAPPTISLNMNSYGNIVNTTVGSTSFTHTPRTQLMSKRATYADTLRVLNNTAWTSRSVPANEWTAAAWSADLSIFAAVSNST
ncbi:hypothetical protein EBS40_08925, partial [bacterium]|nr:hypothetical protein [bacterium]